MNLYASLEQQLKKEPNFVTDNGELKKWVVLNKAQNFDEELIGLLLNNADLKEKFFVNVKGTLVFNQNLFVQFLEQKNYLNDSYTQYKNKVGLSIDGKYLKQRNEVALVWPFKDCILEGGQSREEDKREEIFFNEILAQDEITQLLEPKILTNAKRIDQDGEHSPLERWTAKQDGVENLPHWKARSLFPFWTLPKNKALVPRSKELRKQSILSEVLFWKHFKQKDLIRGWDIDRQVIIGNYIVDFFIAELGLVVEIDGSSHNNKKEYDEERELFLRNLRLTVVRFTDAEVKKNIGQVADKFVLEIEKREIELRENNFLSSSYNPPRQPLADTPQRGEFFNRNENGTITDNLIIKGNNLLVLHTLKEEFAGKVKLIYIDPPYNTGKDGFNYNDSFNHSTWLTFMKNRLSVARELLRKDGVIFIQCDDNEQAYLKVLMDDVFGRENSICDFIWQKKTRASDAKNIAIITEYTLCYAKNNQPDLFSKNTESYDYNRYKLFDNHIKERGNYYIDNLDRGGLSYSDSFNYAIKCPDGTITFPNGRREYKNDGWIWKWGKNKVDWALKNDFLEFRKSNTKESGWAVCYKNYLFVDNEGNSIERAAPHKNLILDVLNNDAANEMKALFGEKLFSYPKPEKLIKRFIDISTKEKDLILDFHLGSGTTAAVAHKMKRQYIGVEQMDYIETVAVERLKKVIGKKVPLQKGEIIQNELALVSEPNDGYFKTEYDQGGISKSVNWQGGGSFVYIELKKYNQTFIEQIASASSATQLLQIWEQMKAKSFLNYNVDIKKQDEHLEEFKALSLAEQKQHLCELLDKNQLYVNLSSLNDADFSCTEEEKKVTKDFYRLK